MTRGGPRRLLRTFGPGGILLLPFAVGVFLVLTGVENLDNQPWLVIPYGVLSAGAVVTVVSWGVYSFSARTRAAAEVVPPLVGSTTEYCLLLRPFGACGETIVRTSWGSRSFLLGWLRPTSTLEQVIAHAARRSLGLRTYAVVDQGRTWAPPGPVYLRAPDEEWKPPVRQLIGRAHSVVLLLAPRQEVREAVWWELHQIVLHDYLTRLVIVLPPADQAATEYRAARDQLCRVLAALDDPLSFNDDDVDLAGNAHPGRLEDRIAHYDRILPGADRDRDSRGRLQAAVQVVNFIRASERVVPEWRAVDWRGPRSRTLLGRRKRVLASTYTRALGAAFDLTARDLH